MRFFRAFDVFWKLLPFGKERLQLVALFEIKPHWTPLFCGRGAWETPTSRRPQPPHCETSPMGLSRSCHAIVGSLSKPTKSGLPLKETPICPLPHSSGLFLVGFLDGFGVPPKKGSCREACELQDTPSQNGLSSPPSISMVVFFSASQVWARSLWAAKKLTKKLSIHTAMWHNLWLHFGVEHPFDFHLV